MSVIETVSDVNNTFLSRREITCNFAGLGGRLKKLDAVDMITKEFKLDGRFVIPVNMTSHVGKPLMTGTFYVYEDELLAKKQVDPTIFARLERARKKVEEANAAEQEAKAAEEPAEAKDDAGDAAKSDAGDAVEAPAEAKDDAGDAAETKADEAAEADK